MASRFQLYVKASTISGKGLGDCPFSQYVMMVMDLLGLPAKVIPINLEDKPKEFLELNPNGSVPVLVDTSKDNLVISDSKMIVEYLQRESPDCDIKVDYNGPAISACSQVFNKFAGCVRNKDEGQKEKLTDALLGELKKLNNFLESDQCKGPPFLLGDKMCAIDCSLLPKLNHLKVAGKKYLDFEIPDDLTGLLSYMDSGMKSQAFSNTTCADEEIISGWRKHAE